jgi:hypothetical protein
MERLIWELECKDKEFSLQAREAKGLPPPGWALAEPPLCPGDDFFLTAFYDLSTCRPFTEGSPGPIPWHRVVEYADRSGLHADVTQAFVHVLREMDSAYMKWAGDKMKASRTPPPKTGGARNASAQHRSRS